MIFLIVFQEESAFVKSLDFASVKKKEPKDLRAFEKLHSKYTEDITEISKELDQVAPNMRAIQRYETVQVDISMKFQTESKGTTQRNRKRL